MDMITLDEFKAFVRIGHDDEDVPAQAMVDAANSYVYGLVDPDEDYAPPPEVKQATLMIAAHWFEHRETAMADILSDIPFNAGAILINHRKWAFG
ncbi:MAG: phage gp6-like head-tail connector protein [Bosea sp.]|uniref:head-tail connector protein n=1 Tax=Bosea sp. (in: a-proteobacteria) TaxID=1871050 RepID=UPI001AC0F442|nr:head-tail connector protein [Bosea sp. (in: a-proteobacteria)]MBN9470201.1 phage gp6-like head-tail connector protein [Bosea sp. (in: a-proteobacteria)]